MVYTSRKYVDLILKASAKWATLEPFNKKVEPGDYGKVDPETGEFEYRGNIYNNKDALKCIPDLKTEKYKPCISNEIEQWVITATSTKQLDGDVKGTANAANVGKASIKIQFSFKRGSRGAFLVMYRPRTIDLPRDIILHQLKDLPELKGMYLVTSVVACPAYSLYLSDKQTETVSVSFKGSLPVPAVPGVIAGGEVTVGWVSDSKSGLYQDACDLAGAAKYTPLFGLKQIRSATAWFRKFRDSTPPPMEGDDFWMDVDQPLWPALDEDGEEEEFFDDILV